MFFFTRRSENTSQPPNSDPNSDPNNPADSSSETSSDSDNSLDEAEIEAYLAAFRSQQSDDVSDSELDPKTNLKDVIEALETSETVRKNRERNDPRRIIPYDPFDFPRDPENWTEEDLREFWDNSANRITGTGWDPVFAEEDELDYVSEKLAKGKDAPVAPFYLPYRKPVPPVPDNNPAIKGPMDVIEELDRIEEFLKWVSYVFEDGSTYVQSLIPLLVLFHFSVLCK